jgi:hypothetical protein
VKYSRSASDVTLSDVSHLDNSPAERFYHHIVTFRTLVIETESILREFAETRIGRVEGDELRSIFRAEMTGRVGHDHVGTVVLSQR